MTQLNRMSYCSTIGEAVGDPKALVRTSGLMLLILVEVRGPIWITSFVTQDANQLQVVLNMLPYASTLSNPPNRKFGMSRLTGVTLHCLPRTGDKYVTHFRIALFRHLDSPFSPQAAKPVVGYTLDSQDFARRLLSLVVRD